MGERKTAADAIHQLTQFLTPNLGFEFAGQRREHAAPLRRNLTFKQVVDKSGYGFRKAVVLMYYRKPEIFSSR
jgi:hypothetical protein